MVTSADCMRNPLTYGTTITNMSDMLKRFYEQLEIEQENVRELEKECETLSYETAKNLAEYITANALLKEREDVLNATRERVTNIQNDIDSLLDA